MKNDVHVAALRAGGDGVLHEIADDEAEQSATMAVERGIEAAVAAVSAQLLEMERRLSAMESRRNG